MPEVTQSVTIDASPEEVFDVLTDPNRASEWSSTARSSNGPYPLSVGDEFSIDAAFLGKSFPSTQTVREHERPTRFAYSSAKPVRVAMAADIEEVSGGTKVTVTVDLDPGMLFAAAGPLLKRQMRKQLDNDLRGLKALVES